MPVIVGPLTFEFTLKPGIKTAKTASTLNNPLVQEKLLHTDIICQWLVRFRNKTRWQMLDCFGWCFNNYPATTK
ncbi:hypothetical protein OUHCRE2_48100 [Enterobacter asburiae]